MWEISNTLQAVDFSRAIIFGIVICAFYGLFAALRKIGFDSNLAVTFEDIFFILIVSPLIFLFLIATTNGEIRFYIGVGLLSGFFIFKITLFKVFVFILSKFLLLIMLVKDFFKKSVIKIINFFAVFIMKMVKKLIFLKKAVNSFKKGLKKAQ